MPGFDFSFTWNQDGSNSVNAGVNMSLCGAFAVVNLGIGYNYNSYSGSVISTHAGVCFGAAGVACAGVDFGYSASWDSYGNFMGLSVYAQLYGDAFMGFAHVSGGYEKGLFGAESRGLYAGGTFVGLHGEVSQSDGGSWGFEESVYLGFGNNTGNSAADDKTTSLVSAEFWLPTLGRFGHFTFGDQYDVSSVALDEIEISKLKEIVKDEALLRDIIKAGSVENFGKDLADRIDSYLLRNGYERNNHFGEHEKGSKKRTYRPIGTDVYGNLEMVVRRDGSTYSSYNYGNNRLSHFLIDYLGWKGRGY